MSAATVFVDDAVQGHLPYVCVRTGQPANGLHRIHKTIGGSSGWLWLLIFLGPFGWMFLIAALVFSGSSRQLLVRLPYSSEALNRERGEFRAAVGAGFAMFVGFVAALVAMVGGTPHSHVRETIMYFLIASTVCAAIATFALALRYSLRRPGIELDASGRWVTLRGVHRDFADAVNVRTADQTIASRP